MNNGTIGRYLKSNGTEEVRIHFTDWPLPDGRILGNVSVFPHVCSMCAGGDHTHIEMDDIRESVVIHQEGVVLSAVHRVAINQYLIEKTAINALTKELLKYIA